MTESHSRNTFDDDVDIEAPEADVLEQHTSAGRDRNEGSDEEGDRPRSTPFEADDADAAEQSADTDLYDDEDDYRD
jgi:hypothetical protein